MKTSIENRSSVILFPHRRKASDYYSRETLIIMLLSITGLIYLSTTSDCIYPGTSATAMAKVAGLLPEAETTHPLWLFFSKIPALIPIGTIAARLNIFSAACGTLSVYLLFRISSMLIYDLLLDKTRFAMEYYDLSANTDTEDTRLHNVSTYGALASALALSFCSPFWIATISFTVISFETMFFLLTLLTALQFILYGNIKACFASLLLCGMGSVECGLYLIPLSITLIFILIKIIHYEITTEFNILLLTATFALGVSVNLLLLFALEYSAGGISTGDVFSILKGLIFSHAGEIGKLLPRKEWHLIVMQTLLPLIISVNGIKSFFSCQTRLSQLKWIFLFALVTAACCFLILDMPGSTWRISRNGSYLPVLPYLCLSMTTGFITTFWILISQKTMYHLPEEIQKTPFSMRVPAIITLYIVGISLLMTVFVNYRECDGRNADFFDKTSRLILSEAQQSDYLVTDGVFDMNLLLLNKMERYGLIIVRKPPVTSTPQTAAEHNRRKAPFSLVTDPNELIDSMDIDTLLRNWTCNKLESGNKIAFIGSPNFVLPEKYTMIPHGLIYSACINFTEKQKNEFKEAAAGGKLNEILDDLKYQKKSRPLLSETRFYTLNLIGRMINAKGIFLENENCLQAAFKAYNESLEINPEDICTHLNIYGYILKHGKDEEIFKCTHKILDKSESIELCNKSERTKSISRLLMQQPPDIVFPESISACIGEVQSEQMIKVLKNWHDMYFIPPDLFQESHGITSPENLDDTDIFLTETVKKILNGETELAANLLNSYLFKNPDNLSALTLLAQIYLNNKDYELIKATVLPKMYKIKRDGNSTIFLTEGCYHKYKPEPDLELARTCFLKSLKSDNPQTPVCSELLETDRLTGIASHLKEDAEQIINVFPDDPDANMILGSYYLSCNNLNNAKSCLQRSLRFKQTPETYNDLAEIYILERNFKEAEECACKAIRGNPYFAPAWDTLSNALCRQGRLDDAEKKIRCAIALRPDDTQLYLTHAVILIRKGDSINAQKLLMRIKPLINSDDTCQLSRYNHITNML